MMDKLLAWDGKLSMWLVWIGGAGLLGSALMVTVDVALRDLLGVTLGGADEISGYIFAVSTAFALPYALLNRTNVRIDALYILMPGRVRAILDMVSTLALAVFAFPLTWWVYGMVSDSIALGTRSITPLRTPVAIPQTLWLGGLTLFCLTLVLVLVVSAIRLSRGDHAGVHAVAGVLTINETIDDETPTSGQVG